MDLFMSKFNFYKFKSELINIIYGSYCVLRNFV